MGLRHIFGLKLLVVLLTLNFAAPALWAQNREQVYVLKLTRTENEKVVQFVKPRDRVRIYFLQSDDDYFANGSREPIKNARVDSITAGFVHVDGRSIDINTIDRIYQRSSGRPDFIAAGALAGVSTIGFATGVGLVASGDFTQEITGVLVIVTSLTGYVYSGFAALMGMLSQANEYKIGERWRIETVQVVNNR